MSKEEETITTVGYNIPLDLTVEILLRLPAKSVFRFRCVSSTWCSILRSRQFAEAYMSLSLSRPRLLFSFNYREDNQLMFFSSPDDDHKSCSFSMVASKNNILTMPKFRSDDFIIQINSVRGFVCCSLKHRFVVCNPNTGQVIFLPEDYNPVYSEEFYLYLGYDSVKDQYKVFRLEMQQCSDLVIEHSVCTLGGGGEESSYSWRRIESSTLFYYCRYNGVCIDGVVYYAANIDPCSDAMVVSSFDVATEQIRLVKTPENMIAHLTNYLGKLAAYDTSDNDCIVLWVLDDVKKQVWSKKTCVFSSFTHSLFWDLELHFAGVNAAGEIVYVPMSSSYPFELLCYHVEKKVERRVRVDGLVGDVFDGSRCCTTSQSLCFASVSASCCYVDNIMYL